MDYGVYYSFSSLYEVRLVKKLGQIFRQAVDVVNDGVVVLTKDAFDAGIGMRIQRPP
jgi:hypothetical protein